MKILVTGAAGMLANNVVPHLKEKGHDVISTDIDLRLSEIQQLDVTVLEDVEAVVEQQRPDYVFHLAAATNVDRCQQEPDWAYMTNTLGTENVAYACKQTKTPLVYISTGSVFSGEKETPYTEFDTPDPANIYADSKYQGELIVQDQLTEYFILRAGWLVGGWDIDKKFVYKIAQQVLSGKTEIRAVDDKFGSPTFTWDFAKQIMPIIQTKRYGLYHLVNEGTASRFEIACRIVEYMGQAGQVKVTPISSDEFPLPAPRGRSEMMSNYKLKLLSLDAMPKWEASLKEYIIENAVKANVEG